MAPPTKVQKIMVQPISLIFRYLQSKARVQIWLFEQLHTRIEGKIVVSHIAGIFGGFVILGL